MKQSNIIAITFLLTFFAFSMLNIGLSSGGWETDPTGDAGVYSSCDITKVNVDVTYHSHPEDDDITLMITLAQEITINTSSLYSWFDYNFYVDTSLSDNTNTSELTDQDYEYRAHLGRKYNNDTGVWTNTSSLYCTRYYYTGDGLGKTMGSFYWNPNTDSWQATNPELEVGQVIGNTIVWDVTSAIYREQPIGTGYVVQGVATASYNLNVKDVALESGWVDEFDNCCPTPGTSTPTGTPTLPSIGFLFGIVSISLTALSVGIIRNRR